MEKTALARPITDEEKSRITEKRGVKKILGSARHWDPVNGGKTLHFLDDGTEVIEDDDGKKLAKW